MKRLALVLAAALLLAAPAVAQETDDEIGDYIRLLKADLAAESREIVAEVMQFTDVEAELFWPIYDEYLAAAGPLFDRRVAVVREFAESWPQIPDKRAAAMAKESLDVEADILALQRATYEKIAKKLNATTGAKWLQIDARLRLILRLQTAAELPIVP